jgi:ribonuclease Z
MKKEHVETFLVTRMMSKRQKASAETAETLLRGDAITAVLVGTGGPFPSGRAQSCTALFVNGQFLLFDAGDGAAKRLEALNLPVAQLTGAFMTHYHADHYADLGEVIDRSWIMGRRQTLPVYGPPGIAQIVDGFHRAYALEYGYRTAHHGAERMPPQWAKAEAVEFQADESELPAVVYDQDGVRVTAFAAQHPPIRPNVGYRVEYAGKSVVLSGDTVATDTLLEQSRGADLLISDVMAMDVIRQMQSVGKTLGNEFTAHIMRDIRDYHIGTEELGMLAQKAQVKRLALTHLSPPVDQRVLVHRFFKRPIAARYSGEIYVGPDGTRIVIPLDAFSPVPRQ